MGGEDGRLGEELGGEGERDMEGEGGGRGDKQGEGELGRVSISRRGDFFLVTDNIQGHRMTG